MRSWQQCIRGAMGRAAFTTPHNFSLAVRGDKLMGVDGQPKLAKGDEDPSHTAPVALAVVILPGQS